MYVDIINISGKWRKLKCHWYCEAINVKILIWKKDNFKNWKEKNEAVSVHIIKLKRIDIVIMNIHIYSDQWRKKVSSLLSKGEIYSMNSILDHAHKRNQEQVASKAESGSVKSWRNKSTRSYCWSRLYKMAEKNVGSIQVRSWTTWLESTTQCSGCKMSEERSVNFHPAFNSPVW